MNNSLHDIDKLFRDGIEGRSEYPPRNVWDNIASELDRKNAIKYKRKYNSLKRKTVILLFLFLGFILYEKVTLYQREGNTLATRHDPATGVQPKPDNAGNSVQNEEVTTPFQEADVILGKSEDLKSVQLPAVTNIPGKENNTTEKNLANTHFGEVTGIITNRQWAIGDKKSINNPITGSVEDFAIMSPVTANAAEISDHSNSSWVSSATEISETKYLTDPAGRLLSFTITPVDHSWKKDITKNLLPAVINPVMQLAGYTVVEKQNGQDVDRSGFSLAVQFTPNYNWNSIKDNDSYHRQRNGNGGGGNGGGNGGGGNGGGGNGGGNVGGGNGGSNSGGGTGGGNGRGGGRRGHNDEDRHEIRNSEYYGLAYSGGINLSYDMSKRISWRSGLNYLVQSIIVRPQRIYAERDNSNNGNVGYRINNSSGYAYVVPKSGSAPTARDSIVVNDTRNSITYLGVPVSFEYKILASRKFSLSASVGGQVNFLMKGKTTTVFEKGSSHESHGSGKIRGLNSAYVSALTSLTAEMRLNKKLSLTLAPAGQFGLTYVNKGTSVKTRSNYLGVAAGVKLRL